MVAAMFRRLGSTPKQRDGSPPCRRKREEASTHDQMRQQLVDIASMRDHGRHQTSQAQCDAEKHQRPAMDHAVPANKLSRPDQISQAPGIRHPHRFQQGHQVHSSPRSLMAPQTMNAQPIKGREKRILISYTYRLAYTCGRFFLP